MVRCEHRGEHLSILGLMNEGSVGAIVKSKENLSRCLRNIRIVVSIRVMAIPFELAHQLR